MTAVRIFGSILCGLALTLATAASAEKPGLSASQWQDELDKVDAKLRAGNWKKGQRAARRTAEDIVRQSWYGAELRRILAELAFYQAAAAANMGQNEEAIWYWHIAQNVDPRIRKKDPAPYGDAGKLLREFLLRKRGEAPARFRVARPGYGKRFHHPVPAAGWAPSIPMNAGAKLEGAGHIRVELIVDRQGRPHHPVLISTYLHPVVVYSALDSLRTMPPFQPASDSGEPVDSLFEFTAGFKFSRWDQGGKVLGGRIQNQL